MTARQIFFPILFLGCISLSAQQRFDSLKLKQPEHYFNTVISIDGYRKPTRDLPDTSRQISRRLQSYGIRQRTLNFHTPLRTKSWLAADSAIANSHLLLTGTLMILRPQFGGIQTHDLVKAGVGIRYIYNPGKKGIWFFDVSPFMTRDVSFGSKPYFRLASTIVYSHNVSPAFNWRIGVTKSFLWGNRYYLPFIGLRAGRLDKVSLSLQFPRSLSLSLPASDKSIFSLYSRAQGGMFNFANADSLYKPVASTFHFARYELCTGIRFDYRAGSHFSFYLASGFSTRNNIAFYSDKANQKRRGINYNTYFYNSKAPSTLFLNLGLIFRFGKTRSYYNMTGIYDAVDLNNKVQGNNGATGIPLPAKERSKINLRSVEDLVDYSDF